MDLKELALCIRDIPDFPKEGIVFKDITPLLNHPESFRAAIDLFVDRHRADPPDRVVGVESRGLIFATAMALELGVGLVMARKAGKLPHKCIREIYELEYGQGILEMHEDAIQPGERVVIVDDLLATGGTLEATCRLVEKLGGKIAAIGTLVELEFLDGRKKLGDRPFYSFLKY